MAKPSEKIPSKKPASIAVTLEGDALAPRTGKLVSLATGRILKLICVYSPINTGF